MTTTTTVSASTSNPCSEIVLTRSVYICGPMRGIADLNFPAFDRARDMCIRAGFRVISPADLDRAKGLTNESFWTKMDVVQQDAFVRDAIMDDLQWVAKCDAIYCLKGWERSRGGSLEHALAVFLNKEIIYQ